ncbi:MAG: hypothetical protein H6732_05955 [Alphaproteobacteria bacterium]|nr:hypothetical protein [Alphaproteobacteria bacterium]
MLLLVVAAAGVLGIVLVVHLLGGSVRASVGTPDAVRARYRRDVVGSVPEEVVVGDDGRAALVVDPEVGVAAVVALGDGLVIRPLVAPAVAWTPDGLAVDPRELLLGPFVVRGAHEALAPWFTRLGGGADAA